MTRRKGQSLGYGVEVDPSGRVVYEHDTFTCGHCGLPQAIEPGQADSDWCSGCDKHICPPCGRELSRTLRCRPTEMRLDALERAGRAPIDAALARQRTARSILG